MAKKKSYNPFKMWGSYVGAFLGFLLHSLINGWLKSLVIMPLIIDDFFILHVIGNFKFYILYLLIGFLIGWGIHSLIRRLRK